MEASEEGEEFLTIERYDADDSTQLSFETNVKITILYRESDTADWWYGRMNNGTRGAFVQSGTRE